MSARLSCPPAPGPLEAYAMQFDSLLKTPAQSDRVFARICPAGCCRTTGPRRSQHWLVPNLSSRPRVQRLQFFLSEAAWDAEAVNAKRVALLKDEPATAPSAGGVLVIDDTGDCKKDSAADSVARQYLGLVGKIDNGIVAVTTLWADEAHTTRCM